MNKLEAEVEKFLRSLEREEEYSFKILQEHKLEGASGRCWKVDFVIKDFNEIKYLLECKDVSSPNIQTFHTQMCRAYTELCDLLLKLNDDFSHPTVRGIVVVRDIPYIIDKDRWSDEFEKWWNLFHPINTEFFNLSMFEDEELGIRDLIRDKEDD
jgi:hypothetical protein